MAAKRAPSLEALDVVDAPLSALKPAAFNPRTISKDRFRQLVKSLEADPQMLRARPLIALPDGTVVCGNMRWRAAEELGWPTIPTVYADLDERRAREWMLRDNNEYGDWQQDELAQMLGELKLQDSDLETLGFSADELNLLIGEPDFEAVAEEDQKRLDERKAVTCPECGHEFVPAD